MRGLAAAGAAALAASVVVWTPSAVTIQRREEAQALQREHGAASSDPCSCLPWPEAYRRLNGTCGSGLELYHFTMRGASLEQAFRDSGHDFCFNFFKKLKESYCVNIAFTLSKEWYGGSWCYVSEECKQLNGGKPVRLAKQNSKAMLPTPVSYKVCNESTDDILGHRKIAEVAKISKEQELEISLLLKMAFPTWTGKPWEEVEPYWDKSIAPEDSGLRPDTRRALKEVSDSGRPMLFDSAMDGGLPITVVEGNTAHQVQVDAEFISGRRIKGFDTLTWLVCIHNCSEDLAQRTSRAITQSLQSRPLPAGWHQKLDNRSGKLYYWSKNHSTTWQRPTGNCTCLNWYDVYHKLGLSCGDGLEFARLFKFGVDTPHAKRMSGWAYCTNFFERIRGNFCTRVSPELTAEWYGGSWCYVSSQCQDLQGGIRLKGTEVSYKYCTAGEDDLLGDRSPEELVHLQKKDDLDMGMIVKMAYPVWPRQRWAEVKNFWKEADVPYMDRKVAKGVRPSLLRALVDTGKPMIFESQDGGLPFTLTKGMTAYKIGYSAVWYASDRNMKLYLAGNVPNVTELVCFLGCLPAGWHATLDKASGNSYYWHDSDPTGTITWTKPTGRQTTVKNATLL